MKFMDLAMGQQFELDGEVYVRTGPLVAAHAESGKQRFMARYMMIRPAGAAPDEALQTPEMLSSDTVNRAFEIYHGHCKAMLGQLESELPADRLSSLRAQLDQARHAFLETLTSK